MDKIQVLLTPNQTSTITAYIKPAQPNISPFTSKYLNNKILKIIYSEQLNINQLQPSQKGLHNISNTQDQVNQIKVTKYQVLFNHQ